MSDFPLEGGCMLKCATKMNCGHTCPKMCHANDRSHSIFKCREKCARSCPAGHPCPVKCFVNCPPCSVKVTKTLACLHEQVAKCHGDPAKEFCYTIVWKVTTVTYCVTSKLIIFKNWPIDFTNLRPWKRPGVRSAS